VKLENTACLRFELDTKSWDEYHSGVKDNKHPSEYEKGLRPNNILRSAWIPQTLGDQIWV